MHGILVAHHSIHTLSSTLSVQDKKRKKRKQVDVGHALLSIEVVDNAAATPVALWAKDVLADVSSDAQLGQGDWGVVRLHTRCVVG